MNKPLSSEKPWFAPEQKDNKRFAPSQIAAQSQSVFDRGLRLVKTLSFFRTGLVAAVCYLAAGFLVAAVMYGTYPTLHVALLIVASLVCFALGSIFVARQAGKLAATISPMHSNESHFALSVRAAQGEINIEENKTRPMPAPELALQQFILQVRSYATEKAYQRSKPQTASGVSTFKAEPADLLKRRWEEVMDSLNEFEIYLANDPQGVVEKLLTKFTTQAMDVSQVFREVAESFDNTWRRKGINIETAIVTPLRANTNEGLLRRLLVGPWRASAYLARRGNGVVFSAKSAGGKVVAHWECDGPNIPEAYLDYVLDSSRTVNDRIEKGMQAIATDPGSTNTLNALISLVTWIDLAQAAKVDFLIKNTNDGFVIELNLK